MTTKAELNALEKVFAAEIEGHLPFQSKARIFKQLEEDGLLAPFDRSFGSGWSKVKVTGYQLTHAGRFIYCSSCDENT